MSYRNRTTAGLDQLGPVHAQYASWGMRPWPQNNSPRIHAMEARSHAGRKPRRRVPSLPIITMPFAPEET
jgi:hypothetical protein